MAKATVYPFKTPLALTDRMVGEIDEWRRQQRDLPARAEAIRRLIRVGLDAAEKAEEKPPA